MPSLKLKRQNFLTPVERLEQWLVAMSGLSDRSHVLARAFAASSGVAYRTDGSEVKYAVYRVGRDLWSQTHVGLFDPVAIGLECRCSRSQLEQFARAEE